MARLNELDLAISPVQRPEHPIDAIARVTEDLPDSPGVQSLDDEIPDGLCHGQSSRLFCGADAQPWATAANSNAQRSMSVAASEVPSMPLARLRLIHLM